LLGFKALRNSKVEDVSVGGSSKKNTPIWKTQVIRRPDAPEVAQAGKYAFQTHRAEEISRLLQAGVAVCFPDLRGCGEMRTTGEARGRTSSDTSISANEWMHGDTVLGTQLQELLLVVDAIRGQGFGSVGLWGDSFAPVNAPDAKLSVPYDVDPQPAIGEPMGGLVALVAGLFAPEGTVQAIHIRGGLASYKSVLQSQFLYLPHDALVPRVLSITDIDDVAAVLASRPLRIEAAINGQNQRISDKELAAAFPLTCAAGKDRVMLRESPSSPEELAAWFAKSLGR
jgi:hypothetical protein